MPKLLEACLHVFCHITKQQSIAVAEVVFLVIVKILSRHIAPTSNSQFAINDKGFIVHALINTSKIHDDIHQTLVKWCAY